MEWVEISLVADGEASEHIADLYRELGARGVAMNQLDLPPEAWPDEVEPGRRFSVYAYFPADERLDAIKVKLEEALYQLNRIYPVMPTEPTYRVVHDEDWAESWKRHFHPIRVGRVWVIPSWHVGEIGIREGDITLVLDPGMAFGTGTHPSTQLCLKAIQDAVNPGDSVLDLGCGSGILSITALKFGASDALAVDIDPLAVHATIQNAQANGVAELLTSQIGSLEIAQAWECPFDLVLANILARVIVGMAAEGLAQTVKPGGLFVGAGIIQEQLADVREALEGVGLRVVEQLEDGDWVAVIARRDA
jgi:ribosomal protein L11 methyltransferase